MFPAKWIPLILLCVLLSSCSGTYKAYIDLVKFAFTPVADVDVTWGELQQANNDLLYVRLGDAPRVALGLVFIDNNQLKWIDQNHAMLVTDNGRIIRTIGMENDLIFTSNVNSDPLKSPVTGSRWLRGIDWQLGEYGYVVNSHFYVEKGHTLQYFGHDIAVIKVTEQLTYESPSRFWRFDQNWQNTFWLEQGSGTVLKTVQTLAPGHPALELVFISEIARHLSASGLSIAEDAR
ncbi:YjbF family lipoprotein [Alishewanella jeotgali]|uniref:Lipoprotein n=1 Tax=Alishewanella jeotgali KCTC 22429 TaxID=1129374 RepID=H3ZAW8_9ALTE|nr:YjbF family lipoprotein [Alishewanella jeotgali]EHR42082.1 hypothetical protein AJE_02356 [Alishewanella jeotgali KCTC 22429]